MGRFVLLNALGRGAETVGQAEPGLVKLRKTLQFAGWESLVAAKTNELQAEIVGMPIRRLWLMTRYFTGSVSWVTDFAPYLPQDAAGHYEQKITQVSATMSVRLITLDD